MTGDQGAGAPSGVEGDLPTEDSLPVARILIVSNRLPVTVRVDGDEAHIDPSVGGLATGLRSVHARSGGWWIGWPGNLRDLEPLKAASVARELHDLRAIPIELSQDETETFYERISNGVLWPLVHDRLDQLPLRLDGWEVYERVNARFADAVAKVWRPGDLIWIHDYQLMRLPTLIRQRIPSARIGFFLHVPFPNPEMFLTLPVREWLIDGLLDADLIGFHTRRYRGHFTAVVRRLKGLEMDADGHLRHSGRAVQLGVYPMGIDARDIADRANDRAVNTAVFELKQSHQRLLVGVDRLDYSKGLLRRLVAVERLLERHPEWIGRIRLVQIGVPTRGGMAAYQDHRSEVEAMVGRINGRFGTAAWTPIHYLHRSVEDETLLSLYRTADVMLVTPLRDGMNLVAKEFIACRTNEDGVLILSEFAGAADELTDALIVNPYDIDRVADAIHSALTMEGTERRRRMRLLRERVFRHDVHAWTRTFLSALSAAQVG